MVDPDLTDVPSALPDVHRQSFEALLDDMEPEPDADPEPDSESGDSGSRPARLQKAIQRVIDESSENDAAGAVSAFNSSI